MRYVSMVMALALAACADHGAGVASAKAASAAAGASGVQVAQQVCRRELPVGSNIPVTRCGPVNEGQSFQQMREDLPQTGAVPVTASQFGRTN